MCTLGPVDRIWDTAPFTTLGYEIRSFAPFIGHYASNMQYLGYSFLNEISIEVHDIKVCNKNRITLYNASCVQLPNAYSGELNYIKYTKLNKIRIFSTLCSAPYAQQNAFRILLPNLYTCELGLGFETRVLVPF